MKSIVLFLTLILNSGCQWIATHPTEDAEAVEVLEESIMKLYEYETRTLSPGVPPHKLIGPTGPKGP